MKSVRTISILAKDEKGIASIMVAGIFIVIISLVATGFATLMRREQRQALDKQLSTQAYYAAESGVNDAIKYLASHPSAKSSDCNKTADVTGNTSFGTNNDTISYTCVLVDATPDSLNYNPISTDKSTVLKLTAPGVKSIKISWQPNSGANYVTDPTGHPLPQQASNSAISSQVRDSGILRFSLFPVQPPITREKLIRQEQTLFLYPSKDASAGNFGTHSYTEGKNGQGLFIDGKCNTGNTSPNNCNVIIDNLPSTDEYYIRLKSIYAQQNVQITAYDDHNAEGGRIEFGGVQAVIDATGKANDVLRRIQVRVPIKADYIYPEFAIETTDTLCKKLVWTLENSDWPNGTARDECLVP